MLNIKVDYTFKFNFLLFVTRTLVFSRLETLAQKLADHMEKVIDDDASQYADIKIYAGNKLIAHNGEDLRR